MNNKSIKEYFNNLFYQLLIQYLYQRLEKLEHQQELLYCKIYSYIGNFNTAESIVYGIYTRKNGIQIKYITIKPGKVVKEVEENSKLKIIDNNKNENSFTTTGDSLINENETYKNVIKGDNNQHGKVNVKDGLTFRKAFIGLKNLTQMCNFQQQILIKTTKQT